MNKYSTTLIMILLFAGTLLYGQNNYRNKIRSMFDKTSNGLWIKTYQGTFDNSFPLTIYMGTSEDKCRAIIRYNQNKKTFSLEGTFENDQYVLYEFDDNGLQTGTLTFQLSDNKIIGEWTGVIGLKKYPIALQKIKPNTAINKRCASPYRTKFYTSLDGQTRINLNQQLDNLHILIVVNGQSKEWTFYDESVLDQERVLTLDQIDYTIIPLAEDNVMLKIDSPENKENHHLSLSQNLGFSSEVKLSYQTKAEVHYPYLKEEKFDIWMQKIIQSIWESQFSMLSENDPKKEYSPYDRYDNELFIYTNVHTYTEDIISGLIYIQNKSLNHIETIPFSYNLDKNKPFVIAKLFKKYQEKLIYEQYRALAYQKATHMPDGLEKEWLLSCAYDHAIVTQDAIELYTPFNMIFGNTSIKIPFVEIHDRIKNIPN